MLELNITNTLYYLFCIQNYVVWKDGSPYSLVENAFNQLSYKDDLEIKFTSLINYFIKPQNWLLHTKMWPEKKVVS